MSLPAFFSSFVSNYCIIYYVPIYMVDMLVEWMKVMSNSLSFTTQRKLHWKKNKKPIYIYFHTNALIRVLYTKNFILMKNIPKTFQIEYNLERTHIKTASFRSTLKYWKLKQQNDEWIDSTLKLPSVNNFSLSRFTSI